jgi:molecular chaperone HtpG
VLEINADHPLILRMAAVAGGDGGEAAVDDLAHLLLDQARILEGETVPDPAAFARRMTAALEKGLAA